MMFADGAVWIGAKQGKLGAAGVYVIDGATGARRALLPAARGDVVGIAMDGSRVYSTALEGELALTTAAGAVVFRVRAPAPIVTPPTLLDVDGDGALEVAVGDGRSNVTVFDGKNGKLLWTRPLGGAIGAGLAAADLDGDGKADLVAGTEEGRLFALRGRTGAPLWQAARSSPFRAAPVLCDVDANGKLEVIAGAYEGDRAIFDGATSRERWSQREDGPRREPHAAAGRDAARADGPSREGRRRPLRAGARPRISFAGGVGFCVAGARDDGAIAAPALFADIDPRGSVHQKESEDHEEAEAST